MLFLTTQQLESQGVSRDKAHEASQIRCSNKLFTRASDFPKKERQAAINLCQEYLQSGVFSFIAESQLALTVWSEEKDAILTVKTVSFPRKSAKPKSTYFSSQAVAKSIDPVQAALNSRSSTDNKPSQEALSQLPPRAEASSETSIPVEMDNLLEVESSPNYKVFIRQPSAYREITDDQSSQQALSQLHSRAETSSETSSSIGINNLPKEESSSNPQTSAQKRLLMQYRGVSYEVGSSIDNSPQEESSSNHQVSAKKRPLRKYRGFTY
ncbi:MAG: hypothetical protein AB4426_09015 [Xenococcaceae cyanobacterium]